MVSTIIVFSFLFSFFSLLYEIKRILKTKEFTISSIVAFLFIFSYGIYPFLVMVSYQWFGVSISTYQHPYDYSEIGLFKTLVWQFFGWFSYVLIRFITTRNTNTILLKEKKALKNDNKILYVTNIICLFIGIISIFLWSKAYGGIIELIKVGAAVRSGLSNVNNNLAFVKHFARLVMITSFSSILLIKNNYRKKTNILLFCVSFLFSILFLLANDGRLSTLIYFVILFFSWFGFFEVKKKIGKYLFLLSALAFFGILFILQLDTITYFIRHGEVEKNVNNSAFLSIMNEFCFIIISGQHSVKHALSGDFLIIDDLLNALVAWLPSSLKPFTLINIWDYNTNLATYSFFGQFPSDFISTSLYDLSFAGPMVFGIFWGSILKKVESIKNKQEPFYMVCYCSLLMSIVRIVDYCMLYDFVLGLFALVIFVLTYKTIKRFVRSGSS